MSRRISCHELTAEAWEPFGWLPRRDTDNLDGSQTLHFELGDPHVNVICHRAEEVPYSAEGIVCEMLFHHLTHTQALLVLNCPAVMAVAPASCGFSTPDDLDAVRAFAVGPLDRFVLHRGTWHWGPFPVGADQVDMLNVQGLRYAEDNVSVRLADVGGNIQVVLPGL